MLCSHRVPAKRIFFPHNGAVGSPAALFEFYSVCNYNSPEGFHWLFSHHYMVMPGPTEQCSHFTGRKHSANASLDKGNNKCNSIQYARASSTFSEFLSHQLSSFEAQDYFFQMDRTDIVALTLQTRKLNYRDDWLFSWMTLFQCWEWPPFLLTVHPRMCSSYHKYTINIYI